MSLQNDSVVVGRKCLGRNRKLNVMPTYIYSERTYTLILSLFYHSYSVSWKEKVSLANKS